MSKYVDFYRILQVHSDAEQEMIDAAYRCLCKLYHPDVNNSADASRKMQEINAAYAVIGDVRKRREYSRTWLKNRHPETGSNVAPPEPAVPTAHERARSELSLAQAALDGYFRSMILTDWDKAYQELTSADRANVSLTDFIDWKNAVAKVYKPGSYEISFFGRYEHCEYAGTVYPAILEFSVSLTELNLATGQTSKEQAQKYVARERDGWKVCLGYTDLKPSILKYKCLAQAMPKENRDDIYRKAVMRIDPLTGLLSCSGFIEQAEKEMLRSQRYGNPLTLAIIAIKLPEGTNDDNGLWEACLTYVSGILSTNIRRTDTLGKYDASSFAILFAETKLKEANQALNNLVMLCEDKDYLSYEIGCAACTDLKDGDLEGKLATTRSLADRKTITLKEETDARDARLGKYKVSDLLNFNKKWKNHF